MVNTLTGNVGGSSAVTLSNSNVVLPPTVMNATGTGLVERIGAVFDGGGSAIPLNYTTYYEVPYAVTSIDRWTVICKEDSGDTGIVITPYKDAYVEDDITLTTMCTTGTPPHTTDGVGAGGTSHQAAWDCNITSLAAGDIIQFKVTTAPRSATWTMRLPRMWPLLGPGSLRHPHFQAW